MNHLVSNGAHLLRRSSHLVRTPIRVTVPLVCDEMAAYQVADVYSNGWPAGGFIDYATYSNVQYAGYRMLCAYRDHSDPNGRVIWRIVTTSHNPEFVWYQGAYATSAASLNAAAMSVEAYLQLCAYHFTVPQNYVDMLAAGKATLAAARGSFALGGEFLIDGPVYNPASRRRMAWDGGEPTFGHCVALAQTLGHCSDLASAPNDNVSAEVAAALDAQGDYTRGYRDLWGFGNSNRDGAIPAFQSPPTVAWSLGPATLAALAANGGGWLVPNPFTPQIQSQTSYRPYFWPGAGHEWACVSLWDIALSVEIEIG